METCDSKVCQRSIIEPLLNLEPVPNSVLNSRPQYSFPAHSKRKPAKPSWLSTTCIEFLFVWIYDYAGNVFYLPLFKLHVWLSFSSGWPICVFVLCLWSCFFFITCYIWLCIDTWNVTFWFWNVTEKSINKSCQKTCQVCLCGTNVIITGYLY